MTKSDVTHENRAGAWSAVRLASHAAISGRVKYAQVVGDEFDVDGGETPALIPSASSARSGSLV